MSVDLVIGVNPGVHGAIAFLTPEGELLGVEDMPIDTVQVGKHSRSKVSRHRLLSLLSGARGAAAFVEEPTFRPMKRRNPKTGVIEEKNMGVAGAGSMGITYGGITMALVACGAALTEVSTGAWRAAAGLRGDKDDARRRAAELFPAQQALFARKMDHNRAESCLVGWYGVRDLRGGR